MTRTALCAAILCVVSGCGLPPAVSVASYVVDGALMAATGKSSNDHALSIAMQQDCRMLRAVVGDPVCQDYEPTARARISLMSMGENEAHLMTVSDGRVIRVAATPTFSTDVPIASAAGAEARSGGPVTPLPSQQ